LQNRNLYECSLMQDALGKTLRPGGFEITKKAVDFCKFKAGDIILDLGCGKGATIKYLRDNYNIRAKGLDIAETLVKEAKRVNKDAEIIISSGDKIPFEKESFNGVFAECTLSLMNDLGKTIEEVWRVTKPGGRLVISDIYANKPEYLDELKRYSVNTCLKAPHDLNKLKELLKDKGFDILFEEKEDEYFKQLIIKIIFQYGSMENFWNASRACRSLDGQKFQNILKKAKLGYFLMIAGKGV
jgi:arsenite methyltransferase